MHFPFCHCKATYRRGTHCNSVRAKHSPTPVNKPFDSNSKTLTTLLYL
ncbi:MAG TPA: hypothetical protein IAB41_02300 [Candidatus Scatomorpha intestinipullorum]|nr:hypothetical protein [Candidatus Scatomorpha intestinipullorum]